MNPYLSHSGRLVLFSGLVFLIAGIATTNVGLVLLGQVHIVLLGVAFLLIAPAALTLDRRMVTMRVEPGEATGAGTGHVIGTTVDVLVEVDNASDHVLHNLRARPFGAEQLRAEEIDIAGQLPGGGHASTSLDVTALVSGRWMLHGFDVSCTDPLGLVQTRDYLPATHAFEFYPAAGKLARRAGRRRPQSLFGGGLHLVENIGSGTEVRQLRDFRPGDSLRDVAWKATMRSRKLVSREFEREVTENVYVVLDVSSSMRGGRWPGQKLDWAIHHTVELCDQLLDKRDRVGLMTFDEKIVGLVAPGNSSQQLRRIMHHLVGLSSIVDEDLTELDETEVERLAADYLLVQERLDFRRGAEGSASGVNRRLLDRWVDSVMDYTREHHDSGVLREGLLDTEVSPLREFLRFRGVTIPYRVEARLGMKERGLVQTLEHIVSHVRDRHHIIVVSDLCAIMNAESLVRGVNLVRAERHDIQFVVPFTPWFYEPAPDRPRYEIIRELFTSAEAEERSRIVRRLRSLGVHVSMARDRSIGKLLES